MKRRVPVLLTASASAVIAALAFALSFVALTDLAARSGVPSGQAWMVPVMIDGLAVVATVAVTVLDTGRWYPWALLIVSTGLSVMGNSVHAYTATGGSTIAIVIAAVPPIAVLAAIHLTIEVWRRGAAPGEAALGTVAGVQVPQDPSAAPAALEEVVAAEDVPQEFEAAPAALVAVGAPEPDEPHIVREPQAAAVPQRQVHAVAAVDSAAKEEKGAARPARSAAARLADNPDLIAAAVRIYGECGSFRAVGRQLGVDDRTVRRWRDRGLLAAS